MGVGAKECSKCTLMDCFNILALFARLFQQEASDGCLYKSVGSVSRAVAAASLPGCSGWWCMQVINPKSKTGQDFHMECIHIDENLVDVNSRYSILGFPFSAQGSADKRVYW
jgi:hypothetical protein